MKNRKGFTLIELLAVIVILAIIMVIAVPQILDIISNSRNSAWVDNKKLIDKAVEIDYYRDSLNAVSSAAYCDTSGLSGTALTNKRNAFKNRIKEIADLDTTSVTIGNPTWTASTENCKFTISAKAGGQFEGESTVTMNCSLGKCSYN